MIFRLLYDLSVSLYGLSIRIAAHFNPKAKKWIEGRKDWKKKLEEDLLSAQAEKGKIIWLHAASVGEFEQGKPVLEALKDAYPNYKIAVSFFSPSGYEAARGNTLADTIFYLPLDKPSNAKALVEMLDPGLVVWMKYEYWWHHLEAIGKNGTPLLLVSAIFQERQPFFKWYGSWHRKMTQVFTHVFVQTTESKELISSFFPVEKVTVSGDTRFDRVTKIAEKWSSIPLVEKWIGITEWVIIAGSTWSDDEKLLRHIIRENKKVKWIIAPHKLDKQSLNETLAILPESLKYSDLEKNEELLDSDTNILLFDKMGFLSRLYKYGKICFIGGGFSATGIHNTLEASVYGKPLVFGPEYEEYAEAVGLVSEGAAIPVENVLQLEKEIKVLLNDQQYYEQCANKAHHFTQTHTGATQTVLDFVYKNRLLTNA